MLKIYYLCSEISPFSETYQLSKFSKEFSMIVNENKDVDIRLIQPKYGYISDRRYILREVIRLKDVEVDFNGNKHIINIKSGFIPNSRVQVYFMEHSNYFGVVPDLIYKSKNGRPYSNNLEKFTFFSNAAITVLEKLYWTPDILICNDWQISLLPKIFKMSYSDILNKMKIVFINHEFSDKYISSNKIDKKLNLKIESKNIFESAVKNSNLTYVFENNIKDINNVNSSKKILLNSNHKIINYSSKIDPEDRIDIYNQILEDLRKI